PDLHEATIGPASAPRQCCISGRAQAPIHKDQPQPLSLREGRTMIEAQHLTKRYGHTVAVDRLSFVVRPGRVTGFLGPNGAGKSTTMRMIIGLDRATAGAARGNGRAYRDQAAPLCEVGALLDARSVHRGRTAAQHLQGLARTHGLPG